MSPMLLRLLASKAVRKSLLILAIAVGGAVWGLPPEAIDMILAAIGQ
jgi:hypothetical protein